MSETPVGPNILRPGVTLYLVRHGETDWNREARYQGQRDIPLNDEGRAQAKRNGRALSGVVQGDPSFDFVSSPLIRAVETMQIVREELGLDPNQFVLDDQLRELNYGHWEGLLASELPSVDPVGLAEKARDPYRWRPRGGESYQDLHDRVVRWLATLERNTIAVSHGGVSRVARGGVLKLPPGRTPFLESPQDRILVLTTDRADWL